MNVNRPQDAGLIFKPFVHRLEEEPALVSSADQEIIVLATFTSPVNIRRIMVIGGASPEHHPSILRCYINQSPFDFGSVATVTPGQEFVLPVNPEGTCEIATRVHVFTNVQNIAFYFPQNHGSVRNTVLKYIGLQGEHTHYRREAVDTVYEVLCSGQDAVQQDGHEHIHEHGHDHGHDHGH